MSGTELRCIFEPVLNEVLRLVVAQITASSAAVSRVLLVGGFGENAYLRDSIRAEVKNRHIEVIQSPNAYVETYQTVIFATLLMFNSWTAVVKGALIKGLASLSPAFATVGVTGRSARKHYGTRAGKLIEGMEHDRCRW